MKICLAFLFQNEAHWLNQHMPVWNKVPWHGIVALDGGSADESVSIVKSYGGSVFKRPFDWSFREQLNALIWHCEMSGYDALVRLDPDELMFPDDLNLVIDYLQRGQGAIMWPTVNFEKDRNHWMPDKYPDYHIRAWHLNKGVKYDGIVHIGPDQSLAEAGIVPLVLRNIHLYHYEGLRSDPARRLKHINYALLAKGETPLTTLPPNDEGQLGWRPYEPYRLLQPLAPEEIGLRAPFEDDPQWQEVESWNPKTGDITVPRNPDGSIWATREEA